ncbi:MAG: hypothetical protein OM95_11690 [Bdellovibrio sp. ArHS]|uniref:hypothetical protein n=1 Tax=Bdellovibrio sp. ArHS TaxID=1569284 RepID=UPI0005829F7B|nr:hypothetical protein [Bdellovibrio sp. ArHS]KHD87927.1 MAG: hypothetical protein OM95_11690 [Bdellovibrio sp. ArHS]
MRGFSKCLLAALFFLAVPTVAANELELLFYRAPSPLNWTSPGNLVRSTFKNLNAKVAGKTYPHGISHVNVRLQCADKPSVYRGMTSKKSNVSYLWDFLVEGKSLDTLLINVKGRFYTKEEILDWLPRLKARGYVRSFKILLNESQCARAERYLKMYESLELQNLYGGLRSLPLQGEGAGCSAFAVSFLQILDLFPPEIDEYWQRRLYIPLELLSNSERRARIGSIGFLRGKDRAWAKPSEKHIVVDFWDPERMFQWHAAMVANQSQLPAYMRVEKDSGSPYAKLIWDARGYPTPESYFFQYRRAVLDKTVSYHLKNRERLLTQEEVLDHSSRECRNFSVCR